MAWKGRKMAAYPRSWEGKVGPKERERWQTKRWGLTNRKKRGKEKSGG